MGRFNYRAKELKSVSGLGGILALVAAPFYIMYWIFKIIFLMVKGIFGIIFWPLKLFKK